MDVLEPKVSVIVKEYIEIQYGNKKIVFPMDEAVDVLKGISSKLPRD